MKNKLISCGLTFLLLMSACTAKQSLDQPPSAQPSSAQENAANTVSEQPDDRNEKPEEEIKTVDGYQFVPEYGICEKGMAPIYIMSPQSSPSAKEEDAEIELLSAVYQNGTMLAKFRIKDYSAAVIQEEEAKILLEKEAENYKKQELGETVEWDNSYITIDSEEGILVRSPFENRVKEETGQRSISGEKRYKCIYGEGIPDVGYSFTRSTSTYDYDSFQEQGYLTTLSEYSMEDKVFEVDEPSGIYEIKMPGFQNTLSFEFIPAQQLTSLEELPGYISHGNAGIYAVGNSGQDGIEIQYYTYSGDNDKVLPEEGQCTLEKDGKVYERINRRYWGKPHYSLGGIGKGSQGDKWFFQIPEEERNGSFILRIPKVRLVSQEQSEIIELEIPENEAVLDQKIEFTDSVITISKAKRMEEPVFYGNINGEDVMKPAVYLTVDMDHKSSDKQLIQVLGIRPDTKHNKEANPYMSYMTPEFDDSIGDSPYGRLTGFYAFYEEGDQTIQVQFRNPSYIWEQEFALPIEMPPEH